MLTIAWDVDDVLNDLMKIWFEQYWFPEHPGCTLSFHDIRNNPPHDLLRISLNEYLSSLDTFRLSKLFMDTEPNPRIYDWFKIYGHTFRHIALTAVPCVAAHASSSWVMKHFGRWIRTFHFIPSKRDGEHLPIYDSSKADYLSWLNKVDFLIEDSEHNVLQASKLPVKCFLISRPWNKSKLTIDDVLEYLIKEIS